MEARRRTLDLGWGKVSYLEWGPEYAARTVVLLHGGGVDNAELSWGELGGSLADALGARVLAPDHPGYGQTPMAPWSASQERLVAYVGEFTDALHLRDYAIGGLSLGGGMTLGHVLARPDAARAALLFGSYGLMDHQYEGILAKPMALLSWALLRTGLMGAIMRAYGRNRRLLESSLKAIVRSPERRTPELLDAVSDAAQGAGFAAFEQWQRDQLLPLRARTNYTARLGEIRCPVLIVHGDHDTGVPVARAREAAALLPDATLFVVAGAGHWVQRDRPDVVIPAVTEFLKRL